MFPESTTQTIEIMTNRTLTHTPTPYGILQERVNSIKDTQSTWTWFYERLWQQLIYYINIMSVIAHCLWYM